MKKKFYISASVCALIAIHSLENSYLLAAFSFTLLSVILIITGEYKSRTA